MNLKQKIADKIFPNINETINDLEIRYPERDLAEGAIVTRFAPSPTGFLHTGSLFTSLVSWRFAKQTNGVFFMRLEDTDQKREIKGSGEKVLEQLNIFGVNPDESYLNEGKYGPYVQSLRKEIYHTVIKEMLLNDLAYPCFSTPQELQEIREYQLKNKLLPGYYKEYALSRKLTDQEVLAKLEAGEEFVIRFKSNGDEVNRVELHDEIRGEISFPENMIDVVIMKSDLLPTYHFAHVVDDHFMRTTHITRGEEWLSSVPIHIDMFNALGFELPKYCHLPVIMKLDNGNRRKLSKRKDQEASVDYFLELGYPIHGFLEYLMTLANSNFEEWRLQNPQANIFDFSLNFAKMSIDGALFDLEKIKSISKERLSLLNKDEFTELAYNYASFYNQELKTLVDRDKDYFKSIINIERDQPKPRKDYEKFSDVLGVINFMYDDYYEELFNQGLEFDERFKSDFLVDILEEYKANNGLELNQEEWFANLKALAVNKKFAARGKDYKKNPDEYVGTVGDYAGILRLATCAKKNTPNFHSILTILGKDRVIERINKTIQYLKES